MSKRKPLPAVLSKKCKTCPFRDGSPYEGLRSELTFSALTEASRVCHSTGSNNAINHRTGRPPALCRGARNVQIEYFFRIGFIDTPTDEAWAAKLAEIQTEKVCTKSSKKKR